MKKTIHIAIIGVGLIGGSIARSLRQQLKERVVLYGVCQNPKRTVLTIKSELIDKALDVRRKNPLFDFAIIATPSRTTKDILGEISNRKNFLAFFEKTKLLRDRGMHIV
ncbi:hypothetical protein HYW55_01925 [Candidatus Gottesmanbacteria bacterium]|nr:hypothetical protein [Candidatus Gottesmanbacteria bacterium]